MKLYYSPGACSLAPHIALREIGRSFDLVRVDLRTHKTATGQDYRLINPNGYVPALQLDGEGSPVLIEAQVILQYIADLAPETGLAPPQGTVGRYQLQQWLSFLSTELHKQFSPLFSPDTPALTEERLRGKIGEGFTYIQSVLSEHVFLMGETFTVADAYLFTMLRWCERLGMDVAGWPNIDYFFHRVADRPAVQAALAAEGLIETRRHRRSA